MKDDDFDEVLNLFFELLKLRQKLDIEISFEDKKEYNLLKDKLKNKIESLK